MLDFKGVFLKPSVFLKMSLLFFGEKAETKRIFEILRRSVQKKCFPIPFGQRYFFSFGHCPNEKNVTINIFIYKRSLYIMKKWTRHGKVNAQHKKWSYTIKLHKLKLKHTHKIKKPALQFPKFCLFSNSFVSG